MMILRNYKSTRNIMNLGVHFMIFKTYLAIWQYECFNFVQMHHYERNRLGPDTKPA